MIGSFPLFLHLFLKKNNKFDEIIIFGLIVIIMLFARAHHGLFLAGFLFYLFFSQKKNGEKLTYLTFLMSIFCFFILWSH